MIARRASSPGWRSLSRRIPDVGRSTARHLLKLRVIGDPAGLHGRGMTREEVEVYIAGKHPEWARQR